MDIERDPNGLDGKTFGAKLDAGKSPVRRGLLEYFPRACMAVADISGFGASKYSWGGWQGVPDGINRYGDAEVRHICLAAIQGEYDSDSEKLHAAHEAWNSLARLERILREQEQEAARLLQADADDAVASLPEKQAPLYRPSPAVMGLGALRREGLWPPADERLPKFCQHHGRWHTAQARGCPSCATAGSSR